MKIDYFFAERKYNNYFEEITIQGFSHPVKMDFTSIITRMNRLSELLEDTNEGHIVVQSGDWFYKIETTFYANNYFLDRKKINFDYTCYNLSPQLYITFIGSVVTLL